MVFDICESYRCGWWLIMGWWLEVAAVVAGSKGRPWAVEKWKERERKVRGNCFGVFVLELFTWLQLKGVCMAEISPSKIISFVSLKLGVMMVIS